MNVSETVSQKVPCRLTVTIAITHNMHRPYTVRSEIPDRLSQSKTYVFSTVPSEIRHDTLTVGMTLPDKKNMPATGILLDTLSRHCTLAQFQLGARASLTANLALRTKKLGCGSPTISVIA